LGIIGFVLSVLSVEKLVVSVGDGFGDGKKGEGNVCLRVWVIRLALSYKIA